MPNVDRSPDAASSRLPDDLAILCEELHDALDWVGQAFIEDTMDNRKKPNHLACADRRRRTLLATRLMQQVNRILYK